MNPRYIEELSWRMSEVYAAVVDQILINLARHFKYFTGTGGIPGGAFDYQVKKLAEMGQVTRETEQIILTMLSGADNELRVLLEESILNGLKDTEPALRKAAGAGLLAGGAVPPVLDPSQMQAFQAYYKQSADKLNMVNTVMLESTGWAYQATVSDIVARMSTTQGILNVATGEVITGVSSWNDAIRHGVQKMVQNGITGFVDHGGHKWSPETYVSMDVRTTMANTARAATWERMEDYGDDLYQVSWHNAARELCYPWQGKVISRSDTVRDVEDDEGRTVHVYAQSETSYGEPAGLFGINCGHYPIPFIPGFSRIRPPMQDEEENAKAYQESQQQRYLERKLREEKRDLEVMKAQGASDEEIKAQRQRIRQASEDIDTFCDETGRTRRRNRETAPVRATWPKDYDPATFPTEQRDRMQEYFSEKTSGAHLYQSESQGIINLTEGLRQGIGNVPQGYDGDFSDFEPLTLDTEELLQLDSVHQSARKTGKEYGVAFVDGEYVKPFTSNESTWVEIPANVMNHKQVRLYHAHTNATPPSAKDLSYLTRPNVEKVAVKSINGDVFSVTVGNGVRPDLEEYTEVQMAIRKDVDTYLLDDKDFFNWSYEERTYMAVREQAFRIARHFGWTLEGGRP